MVMINKAKFQTERKIGIEHKKRGMERHALEINGMVWKWKRKLEKNGKRTNTGCSGTGWEQGSGKDILIGSGKLEENDLTWKRNQN